MSHPRHYAKYHVRKSLWDKVVPGDGVGNAILSRTLSLSCMITFALKPDILSLYKPASSI